MWRAEWKRYYARSLKMQLHVEMEQSGCALLTAATAAAGDVSARGWQPGGVSGLTLITFLEKK